VRVPLWGLLVLPFALAGCSGGDQEPADPDWVEVVVPARQMLDLEYTLSSGTLLEWTWQTAGGERVPFQALYVDGADAYPLASEYGAAGQGERTTPQSGRYDLTWDNQGFGNVTVRFQVTPGYAQRLWPPGQGPGCAPLVRLGQVC
jgi:hypothetical protein